MKADEIRANVFGPRSILSELVKEDGYKVEHRILEMLGEIAAQLAELNENLGRINYIRIDE